MDAIELARRVLEIETWKLVDDRKLEIDVKDWEICRQLAEAVLAESIKRKA